MIQQRTHHSSALVATRGSVACFSVCLAVLASACMTNPEDGKAIKTRRSKISFSGSTYSPNELIKVQAKKTGANQWLDITSVRSSSIGQPDPAGQIWYMWGTPASSLPLGTEYWTTVGTGTSRKSRITVRAHSANYGAFSTFKPSAAECLLNVALTTGAGFDFINLCATGQASVLEVACGDNLEACCAQGAACNSGLSCKQGLCVKPAVPVTDEGEGPAVEMPVPTTIPCSDVRGGPCMDTPAGCLYGKTEFMGTITCDANNRPQCSFALGRDYCNRADNNLCGGQAMTTCQYDEQCSPFSAGCNTYPQSAGGTVCASCDRSRSNYCYMPKASFQAMPPDGSGPGDACF